MGLHEYFTLGNSGLRVSRLALGALTFGTDWGWGSDKETARAMFNHFVDAGGNLIDTADMYTNGVSESWVGEFVRERGLRDRMIISTKFGYNADAQNPNAAGNGRKNILRAVEGSLERLGVDHIDLYLLHTWDSITPVEEVMRTFDDLVRSGKVRHIGLSNVPAWYASRAQAIADFRGYEPVCALQLEYSLIERSIEREFIPLGTLQGMGTMVWSPLASGFLSGKYKQGLGSNVAGRLSTMKGVKNPAFEKFSERNSSIVAELMNVADELGRSAAQIATNWVASRPGVATVLVGATTPAQLHDNLQSLDFQLPAELTARLNSISEPPPNYPYTFFGSGTQTMVACEDPVGDKPEGYTMPTIIQGTRPVLAKAAFSA